MNIKHTCLLCFKVRSYSFNFEIGSFETPDYVPLVLGLVFLFSKSLILTPTRECALLASSLCFYNACNLLSSPLMIEIEFKFYRFTFNRIEIALRYL